VFAANFDARSVRRADGTLVGRQLTAELRRKGFAYDVAVAKSRVTAAERSCCPSATSERMIRLVRRFMPENRLADLSRQRPYSHAAIRVPLGGE
jgi:hypothetical protein